MNILKKNQEKSKENENLLKESKSIENEVLIEDENTLSDCNGVNDNNVNNTSTIIEKIPISTVDNGINSDFQLKNLNSNKKLLLSDLNEEKILTNNNNTNTNENSKKLSIEISSSAISDTTNSLMLSNDSNFNENLMTFVDFVVYIRRSRMGLIQTSQQLRFCWKAIVNWINNNIEIDQKCSK